MKKIYETNCGIYMIRNNKPDEVTGICKVYVGSSVNLKSRKCVHFRALRKGGHSNKHLQSAYNKHGGGNFEFITLEELIKLENKVEFRGVIMGREQSYLDMYKCADGTIDHSRCYNICPTAGSNLGTKYGPHSEATKAKIRKANKGKPPSRYCIERSIEVHSGKPLTASTKDKISKANKGKVLSEETRKKLSIANTGKTPTDETKAKMSLSKQGQTRSEETKKKLSTFWMGHSVTTDVRDKISKANKGLKRSEEVKAAQSAARTGRTLNTRSVINLTTGEVFLNKKLAALECETNLQGIRNVCNGTQLSAGGFSWSYVSALT